MDNEKDDSYSQAVAAIIRRHYKESGLSYSTLAERTGLARSTVERVINGKRVVNALYLHRLCIEFGISPGSVLDEAANAG